METGTSNLLISSGPLGWPNLLAERRIHTQDWRVDEPVGVSGHRILIWEEPVSCQVRIGGAPYDLGQFSPCMVVVPTDTALLAVPSSVGRFTRLLLSADFVAAVAKEDTGAANTRIRPFVGAADPAISGIARLLLDVVIGHQHLDAEMVAHAIRELAIRLVHSHAEGSVTRPDLAGRLPMASLARVLDLIARNLAEPMSVDDLAREAGFSRAHFSRAFARSTGRSPHRYLMARRVAMAAHLLGNTDLPLSQIAADCGFHDQAHLSHAFKAQTGQSPRAFRAAGGAGGPGV